jgi:diaminohydroxyphosphoribosylaminopyrimidine deaminase/5-amino-6-(5-phosphoribosylamino)uracil reductase
MHEQFLLAALEQARLGLGHCAPNPSVGAVAVQNGKIIAQAFHKGAGTPHAEQLLLAHLPPQMLGVSVYITLEPCNHWGKTPPCVDALIAYGVEQVFFAYYDPNPVVARNNSTQQLRQHGIEVTYFPLPEIDLFYNNYTLWVHTGMPFVTAKIAQTLDGKIGMAQGKRLILSNELCAQFTHEMRLVNDVILTTAKTIHADNPKLNVRLNGVTQAKPVAIIDTHLTLKETSLIFSTAACCHIYYSDQLNPTNLIPNCSYYAMPMKNGLMDLNAVMRHLGGLGYHSVWVEAGGALFSSLHQERLVDRTFIYLVPTCLGEFAISAYQGNDIFNLKYHVSWQAMGDNMIACLNWVEERCLPV